MRLSQLKIANFRCYKEEMVVDLDDLVVFVGKNDSGKSSLFDALDVFFEGRAAPDKDDACVYTDGTSVRIAHKGTLFSNLLTFLLEYKMLSPKVKSTVLNS